MAAGLIPAASLSSSSANRRSEWLARCLDGADADPLSGRALSMAVLLVILLATIGLSLRAGLYGRTWNVAESDHTEDSWLIDTCARTFILVLLSLLGLLALGVMYGNVLGAVHAAS
jgi:hypothetical protein